MSPNGQPSAQVPIQPGPTIWTYEVVQATRRDNETGMEAPISLVMIHISHSAGNLVIVVDGDEAEDISVKLHNNAVQAKHGFQTLGDLSEFRPLEDE